MEAWWQCDARIFGEGVNQEDHAKKQGKHSFDRLDVLERLPFDGLDRATGGSLRVWSVTAVWMPNLA